MRRDYLKIQLCLLLCLALIVSLCGCGQSAAPEESPAPEEPEELPEENEIEPAPKDTEIRYPAAYAAYLQVLDNNTDDIRMYTWQFDRQTEPPVVLLWDIGGDECPELLYIAARENDFSYDVWEASLEIWTYYNDQAVQLHSEIIDIISGKAAHYCLFQKENSKNLYLYRVLDKKIRCAEFVLNDGSLQEKDTLDTQTRTISYYPKETTLDYLSNGEIVTEEEFFTRIADMLQGMETILFQSAFIEEDVLKAGAEKKGVMAGTPDAVLKQLSSQLEKDRVTDSDELQKYVGQWTGKGNTLTIDAIENKEVHFGFVIHRLRTYTELAAHQNQDGEYVFSEETTGLEGTLSFYQDVILIRLTETPKDFNAFHIAEQGKGRVYVFTIQAS